MTDAEVIRVLMRAEQGICDRVAKRALAAADENHTKVLRSVWRMASERAEHLADMLVELQAVQE